MKVRAALTVVTASVLLTACGHGAKKADSVSTSPTSAPVAGSSEVTQPSPSSTSTPTASPSGSVSPTATRTPLDLSGVIGDLNSAGSAASQAGVDQSAAQSAQASNDNG